MVASQKLSRDNLMSLEAYAEQRDAFRARLMEHKKERRAHIGPHATLIFEDYLTMHYQVQEMLRAERVFESAGIEEELAAYNPLIPDGSNWKATFMLEYTDTAKRQQALAELIGVENRVWVQVAGHDKVWAIADEDLDRTTDEKTSSVHFLRFELTAQMVAAVKEDAAFALGIAHENLTEALDPVPDALRRQLVNDLD